MDNEEYKIDSIDELEFVVKKWRDVENRIDYIAIKISQMANDGEIPVNFVVDVDKRSVFLNYQSGKLRTFPMEVLLLVPDEAVVEELLRPWLDFIGVDENGNIFKLQEEPREEEKEEDKK